MAAFYRDKDAVAAAVYINGFARMALKGGFLYTTSEKGEGYIAYQLPGQKVSLKAGMELAGTRDFGEKGKLYDLIKYPDVLQ